MAQYRNERGGRPENDYNQHGREQWQGGVQNQNQWQNRNYENQRGSMPGGQYNYENQRGGMPGGQYDYENSRRTAPDYRQQYDYGRQGYARQGMDSSEHWRPEGSLGSGHESHRNQWGSSDNQWGSQQQGGQYGNAPQSSSYGNQSQYGHPHQNQYDAPSQYGSQPQHGNQGQYGSPLQYGSPYGNSGQWGGGQWNGGQWTRDQGNYGSRQELGYGYDQDYNRGRHGSQNTFGEGPYKGRGPKGFHRTDDRIKEEVCERLSDRGDIDASDIEVEVRQGEVILKGNVHSRQEKRIAEMVIESLSGVEDVQNQLRIQRQNEDGQNAGLQSNTSQGNSSQRSASGTDKSGQRQATSDSSTTNTSTTNAGTQAQARSQTTDEPTGSKANQKK